MIGKCPHCGEPIEMVPDTSGATLVVEPMDKPFAVLFKTGYAVRKTGRLIHHCRATGKDGHVVK